MNDLLPIMSSIYYPVYCLLKKHLSHQDMAHHNEILHTIHASNEEKTFFELLDSIHNPSNQLATLVKNALEMAGWTESTAATNALSTIFSQIELERGCAETLYYPLEKLNVHTMMLHQSKSVHNPTDFKNHLTLFMRDAEHLLAAATLPSRSLVIQLSDLIRQWFWCIPNASHNSAESVADVSRLAGAIASCLLKQPDLQQFGLVVGDLSGIQRYIFEIAVANQKKVAQRLRARSLFFTLLSEVLCHKIANSFEMDVWNVLMASGGKFYLLLPWSDQAPSLMEEIQRSLDAWSLQKYNGEVVLNLGWHQVDKDKIRDGDKALTALNESLIQRKASPLTSVLTTENTWDESVFMIQEQIGDRCSSCRKFPVHQDELCTFCYHDAQNGQKLQRAKWIVFHRSNQGDFAFFENYSVSLYDQLPTTTLDAYLIWSFEDGVQHNASATLPILYRPLANFVPKSPEGNTLDFDMLAGHGVGDNQLGFFKADVDQLGTIMTFGLKRDNRSVSLGAISNLSFMTDLFFSAWLPEQLREKYSSTYTVFAGGDDLYLIGPWEEIIRLALDVRNTFRDYTGNHPEITLSASLTFGTPRTPIHYQSSLAERDLEKAKELPAIGSDQSRNQVCFLGVPLSWETFHDLFKETQTVRQWWEQNRISSALLHRLALAAYDYQAYRAGDSSKVAFLPNLVYVIKRNVPEKEKDIRGWLARFVDHRFLDSDEINPLLYMGQVVRLLLMYKVVSKEESIS